MKKLTTGVLAGAMLLSLGGVSASATTTKDVELTRDFSINIEEKATEEGLTVEEYREKMNGNSSFAGKKSNHNQ